MPDDRISIDEFAKIEVKVGTVRSAEEVPETDKLLKLLEGANHFSPALLRTS